MDILDEICEYINKEFNLDIKENTRKRDYVEGRALFYFIARKKTNYSYECISGYFQKNHATAVHAIQNIVPHLNEETVARALTHFDCFDEIPRDTIAYLRRKTSQLEKELKAKDEVLRVMPRLEDIYSKLKYLTEEQKQRVNRRNELQFETIDRCLDTVNTTIGTVIEGK